MIVASWWMLYINGNLSEHEHVDSIASTPFSSIYGFWTLSIYRLLVLLLSASRIRSVVAVRSLSPLTPLVYSLFTRHLARTYDDIVFPRKTAEIFDRDNDPLLVECCWAVLMIEKRVILESKRDGKKHPPHFVWTILSIGTMIASIELRYRLVLGQCPLTTNYLIKSVSTHSRLPGSVLPMCWLWETNRGSPHHNFGLCSRVYRPWTIFSQCCPAEAIMSRYLCDADNGCSMSLRHQSGAPTSERITNHVFTRYDPLKRQIIWQLRHVG